MESLYNTIQLVFFLASACWAFVLGTVAMFYRLNFLPFL